MKKIGLLLIMYLLSNFGYAQKMITRIGEITFEASMPNYEEVEASTKTGSCVFYPETGELASLVLMKSFKFKSPLMEEHFNENYIESSKYPKATFKGVVLDFDPQKLTDLKADYDLEGDFTIHGVTRKIKIRVSLSLIGDKISAISNFTIKPQDYKISIPSLVKSKISEIVKVSFNFILAVK